VVCYVIERHITPSLLRALEDSPVVLLHGARQTGKSTLAQWIAKGPRPARYLTFDDAAVLAAARSDPTSFIANLPKDVVLDEVQRAPELFMTVKAAVDRDRRPGRFLLTGSTNILLLPRLSESLAGRMEILSLWPLSQGEIERTHDRFVDAVFHKTPPALADPGATLRKLAERIVRGGYPAVLERTSPASRRGWFGSYITSILQRDVRDLAQIERLTELPHLLALVAARTGTLLNLAELSRSSGIPKTTLIRYLGLLETTFLVHMVPAWSANLSKRLVKSPKVMINDTGLAADLLHFGADRLITNPSWMGPLLETFAAAELRKQLGWSRVQPGMYHFRTQDGQEVDLVLEDSSGRIVGIEVKATAALGAHDFRGLRALAEATGKRFQRGIVLYAGEHAVAFGPSLHAVPMSNIWRL